MTHKIYEFLDFVYGLASEREQDVSETQSVFVLRPDVTADCSTTQQGESRCDILTVCVPKHSHLIQSAFDFS